MARLRISPGRSGLTILSLSALVLLAGCRPVGPPAGSSTRSPSPAFATETQLPSAEATPGRSTPSPTAPSPPPFSEARSQSHRFLFVYTDDASQSVYLYDLELDEAFRVITLPPEISLHEQQEPDIAPSIARLLKPFPAGLPPSWMKISPDGTILLTLQPAVGGLPNYLHQIDLLTGIDLSIRILEDYQWTIDTVPGRTPELGPPGSGEEILDENASQVLRRMTWAPDGSGFSFVLRKSTSDALDFDRFQIYFVPSNSQQVLSLASEAAGESVGEDFQWSPDGAYIAYLGDLRNLGIWLIEMDQPEGARKLTNGFANRDYLWARDSQSIFYEEGFLTTGDQLGSALYRAELNTGETQELLRVAPEVDERVELIPAIQTPRGFGLLVLESHSVAVDASTSTPEYAYSESRSKIHYVGEDSSRELELFGKPGAAFLSVSPVDDWARVRIDENEHCLILTLPMEELVYGPYERLCATGTWSPDGHLLLGRNDEEDFIIFDLDTQQLTVVAPELDGIKALFYGWIPDPSVYDELVARRAP